MNTQIKHKLLDLQDAINQKRDEKLVEVRVIYINELTRLKADLQDDLKAIRITYKEKYEIEKQRVVNNEKQDKQTA